MARAGMGLGGVALASMLYRDGYARSPGDPEASQRTANPLAPKPPHFPPRARQVIFLYMYGGGDLSSLGDVRRRHCFRQVDDGRFSHSRVGHATDEQRTHPQRQSGSRIVDQLRPGERE